MTRNHLHRLIGASYRPGQPVHRGDVPGGARHARPDRLDEPLRRLLRQRDGGATLKAELAVRMNRHGDHIVARNCRDEARALPDSVRLAFTTVAPVSAPTPRPGRNVGPRYSGPIDARSFPKRGALSVRTPHGARSGMTRGRSCRYPVVWRDYKQSSKPNDARIAARCRRWSASARVSGGYGWCCSNHQCSKAIWAPAT